MLHMRMKALKHVDMKELRAWFASGFVQGSKVLTDGWSAYHFLSEAGFEHEAHVSRGGGRSAKSRLFNLKSILPRLLVAATRTPVMRQPLLKLAWMGEAA